MSARIERTATASYRIELPKNWIFLGIEEQGRCYALTETTSNPDPIRPLTRWFIAQSLEQAESKNYERALILAAQGA